MQCKNSNEHTGLIRLHHIHHLKSISHSNYFIHPESESEPLAYKIELESSSPLLSENPAFLAYVKIIEYMINNLYTAYIFFGNICKENFFPAASLVFANYMQYKPCLCILFIKAKVLSKQCIF